MDKAEFVSHAPAYYALAIAVQLSGGVTRSRKAIEASYTTPDESCLIENDHIWEAAIAWLNERGMIKEMKGAFGPALYSASGEFQEKWNLMLKDEPPFNFYWSAGEQKGGWLIAALQDIDDNYDELDISPEDFTKPDREWEPIRLDTSDPIVKNGIEKLSDAVKQIRDDNGYAANLPEERDFVVEGLTGTVDKLKSGTISAGYIRDAWNKLTMAGRRFAGATLEVVITGAKQAIIEIVKTQGGDLLRALLNLFH
jgi:hypothetical protein